MHRFIFSKRKYGELILYISLIYFLVFLSSHQALKFHFWKDDWSRLWMASFRPDLLFNSFGLESHPGTTVEQLFFSKFFGLNPILWQFEGLILKVIASLAIALMLLGITKSKWTAYIGGILFASSMLGLESFTWISAHASALIIIFFGIGFYYWVVSLERRNLLGFFCACIFLSISFFISPARAAMIPLLILVWDLFTLLRAFSKVIAELIFVRLSFFVSFLLLGYLIFYNNSNGLKLRLFEEFGHIIAQPSLFLNYLSSIGNLSIGWLLPVIDVQHFSFISLKSVLAGFSLIVLSIIIFLLFIKRKTKWLQIQTFFIIFILLAYLPNWWFYSYFTVGPSHRYLSLSAIALIGLLVNILVRVNTKFLPAILLFLLAINIFYTNNLLRDQLSYRSFDMIESMWRTIDRTVQPNDNDLVFIYGGEDLRVFSLLDWSSIIPFVIKRNIQDPKQFPVVIYDFDTLKKLVCGEKIEINSLGGNVTHNKAIPLSNVYAWTIENNYLVNISSKTREDLESKIQCEGYK